MDPKLLDPLNWCGVAWMAWFTYWTIASRGVKEAKWSEGFLGRAQHLAPIGLAFYCFFGHLRIFGDRVVPEPFGWLGLALVIVGLAFSVWARIHLGSYWSGTITLKVGHKVIKTGPYSKVRHPIYTGIILASIGLSVAQGGWAGDIGLVLMFLAFSVKLKREEKLLRVELGEEYEEYRRHTWALLPGVW